MPYEAKEAFTYVKLLGPRVNPGKFTAIKKALQFTRGEVLRCASSGPHSPDTAFLSEFLREEVAQILVQYIYDLREDSRWHEAVLQIVFKKGRCGKKRNYYQSCYLRVNTRASSIELDFPGDSLDEVSSESFAVITKHRSMAAWFSFPLQEHLNFRLTLSDLLARLFGKNWPSKGSSLEAQGVATLDDLTYFQSTTPWDTRDAM